jgi:predicted anti-sigma-YlaC factor YlaD
MAGSERHQGRLFRSGACALLVCAAMFAGCSIKKMAVSKVADALAGGGTTFASDNDPELVKAAVPFSLKLMESLLAEVPEHRGLLLATASGFTQYGFAFVQQEADEVESENFDRALAMKARARKLYLRARDYGLRGLDAAHRGFSQQLRANAPAAVARVRKKDVPLLYWTAAAWAAAASIEKDPQLVSEIPLLETMIDAALRLDEGFESGTIHSFLISYETVRQTGGGNPEGRAREHFRRAVELSGGQQAGPYVGLAEAVALPNENRAEFERLLRTAIAIDADARPEWRLANLIYQRRARWLLGRLDELFLAPVPADPAPR